MVLERFPVPPSLSFPLCPHAAPPGLEVSSPHFPYPPIALLGLTLSLQPPRFTDSAEVTVTHKCMCGKGGGHPPSSLLEPHNWGCWGPCR